MQKAVKLLRSVDVMEERIEDELATARRRMEQLNRETDIKILKQQDKEFEETGRPYIYHQER